MGEVKKFLDIEFWAENGIVYLSNERAAAGKDYDSLSDVEKLKILKGLPPKTFLKRAIVLGAMFLRGGESCQVSEYEIYRFLQDAQEVYRKAVDQGPVDSPVADEEKIRHRVYRKPQILVPGLPSSETIDPNKLVNKSPCDILLEGYE